MRKFLLSFISILVLQLPSMSAQLTLTGVGPLPAVSSSGPSLTNMVFWGRGDSLICTPSCSGTNGVTTLVDKSVSANNATASINNGVYSATALNSQPGFKFDGGAIIFTFGSTINLRSASTVCIVSNDDATGSKGTILSGGVASLGYWIGSSKEQGADSVATLALGSSTSAVASGYVSRCTDYDGTTIHFWNSSGADGSNTPGAAALSTNETIIGRNDGAGAEQYSGTIVDIILYNAVITSGARTSWFSYTLSRYGI
jgi:hypothetical protein